MELKCYSCEQRDLGTDKESFIWLLSTCKDKDIRKCKDDSWEILEKKGGSNWLDDGNELTVFCNGMLV